MGGDEVHDHSPPMVWRGREVVCGKYAKQHGRVAQQLADEKDLRLPTQVVKVVRMRATRAPTRSKRD